MEDAMRAYQHCLVLLPYHEEAQNSIEFLRSKNLVTVRENDDHKEKKSKKEKKKKSKKKRHASTSGSSSSSSSTSSDSSSESSSSSGSSSGSSQSSHSRGRRKKSKKNKRERKEKSLSPLSKRMQLMDSGAEVDGIIFYFPKFVYWLLDSLIPLLVLIFDYKTLKIVYRSQKYFGSIKLKKKKKRTTKYIK